MAQMKNYRDGKLRASGVGINVRPLIAALITVEHVRLVQLGEAVENGKHFCKGKDKIIFEERISSQANGIVVVDRLCQAS